MKINKILKWSLVSFGGAAVLGGAAAGAIIGINQTSQVKKETSVNSFKKETSVNSFLKSEVLNATSDTTNTQYQISVKNDSLGTIKLIKDGQEFDSLTVGINEKINVKVTISDSTQTVRDLSVASVSNPSISLGTELVSNQVSGSTRVVEFSFTTPDPEEYAKLGMENPFESGILVSANYIKNTVGNDIDWGYDNLVDQVNSYEVATLTQDTNWSELKAQHGWEKLFNEDSRASEDTVNITVYLDGHKLYIDETIYVPKGYNLNFINLANDAASKDGSYGSVLPGNGMNSVKIIHLNNYNNNPAIGGQVSLWRSVNVWSLPSYDGVLICTPEEAYRYNFHFESVPSVTKSTNEYFGYGQAYVGLEQINKVFNK